MNSQKNAQHKTIKIILTFPQFVTNMKMPRDHVAWRTCVQSSPMNLYIQFRIKGLILEGKYASKFAGRPTNQL